MKEKEHRDIVERSYAAFIVGNCVNYTRQEFTYSWQP